MIKHIFPIALVVVAIVLGAVYLTKGPEPEYAQNQDNTQTSEILASTMVIATTTSQSNTQPKSVSTESTPPPSQPSVVIPPDQPKPPAAAGYTMEKIALHADASSCWTAIGGKVYDLTSWVKQHPGGSRAILSLCGHDGTNAFQNEHGGKARPERELATFFIGDLSS